MGLSSKTHLRVRYSETDKMGIVYHANFLVWFEVGRSELFRELELPYTEFEEQGLGLAVIEANCRYRKPAHYDDELVLVTEVDQMSSRSARFCYHVYREETLLAEGKTVHAFINTEGRSADARRYAIWTRLQGIIEKNKDAKHLSKG
ncbi:acyl-CoA thioesterase [Desulfosporosinus fructosivorans]|uniref:Acyl-CoA thioesterase n=1 Tax=Desulfosporosinus fructosivorans TaxID=2018669 RepID=A0A4Z0R2U9_9FIRM|nr:thioesterase family protein [Desulfosporosinus fructosivorans]TGE37100.1 acyl-CoA thioesterase [Desulfosporosinus fructosivorans]